MFNKPMEKVLKSLDIREMPIKTTMVCHFPSTRMPIIKKTDNSKCWQGHADIRTLLCYLAGI